MSKQKRLLWISDLMLLAVAMVWGTSYGVAKSALAFYPVLGLLALRFGLTFVVLSPAVRSLRQAKASELAGALGTGVLLLSILLGTRGQIWGDRKAGATSERKKAVCLHNSYLHP